MAISSTDYQKRPDETIEGYTSRIASLRSGSLASGPTQGVAIASGDPAAQMSQTRSLTNSIAGATPTQDPSQLFGQAVTGLLTQAQQLGTGSFAKQGFNAQDAQSRAVLSPNLQGLQGASPSQQQSVISSGANIFDPVIDGANKGAQTFGEQIRSFGDIVNTVSNYQQQTQQLAETKFKDLITNFGGEGLQSWAIQNPEQAAQLERTLGYGKGSLAKLGGTLKDQELQIKRQQQQITAANLSVLDESRRALAYSRMATAVNSVIKTLYPTSQANPINAYAASSQAINRVDNSLAQSIDPANPNKGASDLDLVDAYVQIARGGGQITEAQVDTLLSSLGIKARFDVGLQKVVGTAILDDGTRNSIAKLAHNIFGGQQQLANKATIQINSRLSKLGFDQSQLLSDPLDAATFSNLNESGTSSGSQPQSYQLPDGTVVHLQLDGTYQ